MEKKSERFLGIPDVFWMGFIMMVGFFLKLVYDIQIGYAVRTPNAGVWQQIAGGIPAEGQIGVIQYYFTYHRLPDFDLMKYQGFTNPPLFYWVCALILDVIHRMMGWAAGTSLHVLQCINVIYVTVGCVCGVSMAYRFGVRKRKLTVVILLMTFFPAFYQIAAALNPDAMCFMFSMLSLNTALSWYTSRRSKSFMAMAVQIGLGLMTGFGALFVLPPILTLYYFAKQDGRRNETPLHKQLWRMLLIVGIMGGWWPALRLFRYHVPLFYSEVASFGHIVYYGLFGRLRLPNKILLSHLHTVGDVGKEYNLWAQFFKTSVFGFMGIDTSVPEVAFLAYFTLQLCIFLWVLMHIMWLYVMFTARLDKPMKHFLLVGYLTILLGYVWLCLKYPYVEMMNFSRIAVILIYPVIGMGVCGYGYGNENIFEKVNSFLANGLSLIFALLTAFLMGFYP